jgi:hypothetical protein
MTYNKIFLVFALVFSTFSSAQVGIETNNPQGIFNIDGAKDNLTSGVSTTTQQANDLVVTSTGNVGIGTTAPGAKLEIICPSTDLITGGNTLRIFNSVAPAVGNFAGIQFKSSTGSGSWKMGVNQQTTTDFNQNFHFLNSNGGGFVSRMVLTQGGLLGIGTSLPATKLEVSGSSTNTVAFNATTTTIDFAESNLAYTSATENAITLSNIKDGGAYSLIFTSTAVNTAVTFSATGFTFKYMGTDRRTNGKAHIYSFIVAGTVVYVSMSTEN